jgi:hypothetical protein
MRLNFAYGQYGDAGDPPELSRKVLNLAQIQPVVCR